MIKLLFRSIFFTLILCSFALLSKAQLGYDYSQYDLGFGGTFSKVYGDAETNKTTPAVHINFSYNQTPFVNYVIEVQAGKLEGGDALSKSGRYFKNNFAAVIFRGQLQAGELIDYSGSPIANGFKNLYISAGLGYLANDIQAINRESVQLPGFYTGGEDKSKEVFLPLRLGYEFKVFNQFSQPSVKIDFGAQYNIDFSDNMDGFKAGTSNDKSLQYNVSVKFALGGITSYRKQIQY